MISPNFDGTVSYWRLVRSPQFFTNCKIIFFYPRVTDQSLQKVLTTDNTSCSTKCFDYFANELSKFQTQQEKEYAFQFRSNLIDTMLSEVIDSDHYM